MKVLALCVVLISFFWAREIPACELSSIEKYVYVQLREGHPEVAITFLKNLEDIQNPEGIHLLGVLYLDGCAGIQDARLANYYFSKAGALGFAPAIKALADSYMAGDGVEVNKATAFTLYEKAAKLGYGPAQFNAGIMLKNGEGISVFLRKAYVMLDLASKNPDLGSLQQDAAFHRDQVKESLREILDQGVTPIKYPPAP